MTIFNRLFIDQQLKLYIRVARLNSSAKTPAFRWLVALVRSVWSSACSELPLGDSSFCVEKHDHKLRADTFSVISRVGHVHEQSSILGPFQVTITFMLSE